MRPDEAPRFARRVRASVVAQGAGLVISAVSGIAIVRLITADFGKDVFGRYATATGLVTTCALITDLGLTVATVRALARSPEQNSEILSQNLGLRLSLGFVFVPLLAAVAFIAYPNQPLVLEVLIVSAAAYVPFDAARQVLSTFYLSQTRNVLVASVAAAQQILIVAFVWLSGELQQEKLLGAGYGISGLLGSLVLFIATSRHLRVRPRFNVRAWREILRTSLSAGLIQVIGLIYQRIDGVMVSIIAGTTQAGVYAVAYLVVYGLSPLPSLLMSPLLPAMSRSTAGEAARIAAKALRLTSILLGSTTVAVFAAAPDIVHVLGGPEFGSAAEPLRILIISTMLTGCTVTFGYLCVSINQEAIVSRMQGVGLALNVALNLIAIPLFGVSGAAAASIVTEVFLVAGISIRLRRRQTVSIGVLRSLSGPVVAATVTVLVEERIGRQLQFTPALDAIYRAALAVAIFLASVAILSLVARGSKRRARTSKYTSRHSEADAVVSSPPQDK